jgi:hypothetical protein
MSLSYRQLASTTNPIKVLLYHHRHICHRALGTERRLNLALLKKTPLVISKVPEYWYIILFRVSSINPITFDQGKEVNLNSQNLVEFLLHSYRLPY